MRVIGGSAGGRKLLSPPGTRVRPTADRVKEALFSILLSRFGNFCGLTILDLFAGTGNLGIEALSRGCDHAVFVDSHPQSIRTIRDNLQLTGFTNSAEVISGDAVKVMKQLQQRSTSFDIVFLDPPYREAELLQSVLNEFAAATVLAPGGVLVVETDKGSPPTQADKLAILDRRLYGDTAITFFRLTD